MKGLGEKGMIKRKDWLNKLNSLVVLGIMIAILVLANVIAGKLPWTYDMTSEKVFTLSDQTIRVLEGLTKQITIVAFFQEGAADPMIKALLEEYRKAGKGKLRIDDLDAEKNPAAAKKYDLNNEGISNGTVILECGNKVKKISKFEITTLNETGYGKSFNGEQLFTGAIINLTTEQFPKIYFLEGHQEMTLTADLTKLKKRLEGEAQVVESLNLIKADTVPQDADVVAVPSPKRDLNSDEGKKLQDYLERGGRAVFLFDILNPETHLPNFNSLLRIYGIAVNNNFVVEEDSESFYSNNKMYLVPDYTGHSIVEKLQKENLYTLLPYAGKIEILNEGDPTVTVEPLLMSTSKSWIRYHVKDTTPAKTESDRSGPAELGVAVTKDNTDFKNRETKIVVVYNAKLAADNIIDMQGNYDFLMNAFSWVEGKKEFMAVRPKMLDTNKMFVTGALSMLLMALSVLIIPMIAFGTGLVVWMRRRHL